MHGLPLEVIMEAVDIIVVDIIVVDMVVAVDMVGGMEQVFQTALGGHCLDLAWLVLYVLPLRLFIISLNLFTTLLFLILLSLSINTDMTNIFLLILTNLFSITCAILAGDMALNHITGWGWFLVSGVLCHYVPKVKDISE
jgi:hypothetical protein